ncbi:hypothetical protein JOE32_001234 [Pseudomonas sp. PvP025]|nr:hypothetical protein [Pseudomonas sp. PvP025]MDQ0398627.1 hypothetical protein [Pseudomonas sp. PvP006]
MLPIAVCQPKKSQLTRRHREQAPSHILTVLCQSLTVKCCAIAIEKMPTDTQPIKCGRGLAPDSGMSAKEIHLTRRHREQAPSHIFACVVSVAEGEMLRHSY